MPFGKDYEYARAAALPWWLRNFADQQLEKKSNPFDDIKELFRNKNESDSVEMRVSELRERVGLDAIEKVASGTKDRIPGGKAKGQPDDKYDKEQLGKGIGVEMEHTPDWEVAKEITKDHLEESEDFKDKDGGKYYDKLLENERKIEEENSKKKAALVIKLVSIANELEKDGLIKAAQYIDNRIKVLAKEKNYVGDIEKDTEKNKFFRKVLFTGKHAQLVVMAIQGGDELGSEVHEKVDQFFRIEEGEAIFVLDGKKKKVKTGGGVVVPAGTEHNVINASKTEVLKLYTIYSPPNHPPGTIHKTKEDAEKAEKKEHKTASFTISKRAGMDKLPIAADPVLWSDEQLLEVVKTPHLMDELEKKPELLKSVLEQVEKRKGTRKSLEPKDIGHWVERGWFGLFEMGRASGFLGLWNNRDAAEMARQRIIKQFAEGDDDYLAPYDEEGLTQTVLHEALGIYRKEKGQSFDFGKTGKEDIMRGDAERFADEFMNHPFYAERRKKLIESATKVIKMPQNFEPEGNPSVKGGIPTGKDIESAQTAWWKHQDEKEPQPHQDNMQEWEEWVENEPYHQEMDQVTKEFNKAYDDIIIPAAKQIARKQKMRDENIDPDKMADDVRISCRHGFKLSKRAIKWHTPNPMTHTPGQWQNFKLPPGAGTMLQPKTEEEMWEAGKTKAEKPEIKEPETKEPEAPKETSEKEGKTWYLLMAFGQGFGWYRDRKTAEAVRGEMIYDFEKNGTAGETPFSKAFGYNMGQAWHKAFLQSSSLTNEMYDFMTSSAERYRDERDFSASDILEIFEITTDFEPRYVIGEDESPTGDPTTIDNATFSGMGRQYPEDHYLNKMPKDVAKAIGQSANTRKKVLDNIMEWIKNRAGVSADDFYISRRAEQLAEDKTPEILKKYPKLENFIRNVCRTRGGYIEVPAIQNMIRNERKEDIDVTNKELVDFIRACLKEYKEEFIDESDEHDGEYMGAAQSDDDDGNKEVFSKPPTNI